MTPLLTMFLPCLTGMAIGLAIDCASIHPAALASLCSSAADFSDRVVTHWRIMPATHLAMLASPIAACIAGEWMQAGSIGSGGIGRRTCTHAACLSAMLAGMALGGQLGPGLSALLGVSAFAGLTAAMVLGMAAGMAVTTPLYSRLR